MAENSKILDLFQVNKNFANGFAYGVSAARIPLGFYTGKNMMMDSDGCWGPRYSFKKNNSVALAGSSAYPTDMFVYNQDDMIVINSSLVDSVRVGKIYKKNTADTTFTEMTWDGGGDAPTLSALQYFKARIDSQLIFSRVGQTYKILTNGHWNYSSGSSLGFGGAVAEHGNRLLVNYDANTLRYSNTGDPDTGLSAGTQYVNVGHDVDDITGLLDYGGSLVVLKRESIWMKPGAFSELDSRNFNCVVDNTQTLIFPGTAAVVEGTLFIANTQGLMVMDSSGGLKSISSPFGDTWQGYNVENARIYYWKQMGFLILSIDSSWTDTLVYDLNNKRWYFWNGINITCAANSPTTRQFFTGHYASGGDPYIYEWSDKLRPGDTSAEEDDDEVAQWFQTPYWDCGDPYAQKFIRKLWVYGDNISSIEIYCKNVPGKNDPSSASYTISSPTDSLRQHQVPNVPFREISIKCIGTGNMYVKNMAIEVDFRRDV